MTSSALPSSHIFSFLITTNLELLNDENEFNFMLFTVAIHFVNEWKLNAFSMSNRNENEQPTLFKYSYKYAYVCL